MIAWRCLTLGHSFVRRAELAVMHWQVHQIRPVSEVTEFQVESFLESGLAITQDWKKHI